MCQAVSLERLEHILVSAGTTASMVKTRQSYWRPVPVGAMRALEIVRVPMRYGKNSGLGNAIAEVGGASPRRCPCWMTWMTRCTVTPFRRNSTAESCADGWRVGSVTGSAARWRYRRGLKNQLGASRLMVKAIRCSRGVCRGSRRRSRGKSGCVGVLPVHAVAKCGWRRPASVARSESKVAEGWGDVGRIR